jgi:hypothetical protein
MDNVIFIKNQFIFVKFILKIYYFQVYINKGLENNQSIKNLFQ